MIEPSPVQEGTQPTFNRKGAWTEFPEFYKGPQDAITQTLKILRGDPRPFISDLPQVPLPKNYKSGNPLPVELEIAFLLRMGAVGDRARSMVTHNELLEIARNIWGFDEAAFQRFKSEVFPTAQTWVEQFFEKERQKFALQKETTNVFFLTTWNAERLDMLSSLMLANLPKKITNIAAMIDRYKRIQRKTIKEVQQSFQTLALDSPPERQQQIDHLVQETINIISQLTYLTSSELDEITSMERQKGFIFLDTLVEIMPDLYETIVLAKRRQSNLNAGGFHGARGDDAISLGQRESALGKLVFGAKDNTSKRGIVDTVTKKPAGNQKVMMTPKK